MDRGRYDASMFWLAFGTAAAVIGLALMTIGVTRLPAGANVFDSGWFDVGLGLLVLGVAPLLWALLLFLGRRRGAGQAIQAAEGTPVDPKKAAEVEAVRGYFNERERLFGLWERERKKDRR